MSNLTMGLLSESDGKMSYFIKNETFWFNEGFMQKICIIKSSYTTWFIGSKLGVYIEWE